MADDQSKLESGRDERDPIRFVEKILDGVLLFAKRYARTTWDFLFRPAAFDKELNLRSPYPVDVEVTRQYERPLTYLFFAALALLLTYPNVVIPHFPATSALVKVFTVFLEWLSRAISEIDTPALIALIAPFVILVALHAYVTQKLFNLLGGSASYGDLLKLGCYFFGNYLTLGTLMTILAMPLLRRIPYRGFDNTLLLGLTILSPIGIAGYWSIFRYVSLLRCASSAGWFATIATFLITLILFIFSLRIVFLYSQLA